MASSCENDDNNQAYEEVIEIPEGIEPENSAPLVAMLLFIEDTGTSIPEKPVLMLEAAIDPRSDMMGIIHIYLGACAGELRLMSENHSDVSYEIDTALEKGADYFWEVVSKHTEGNSKKSVIFEFSTAFITSSLLVDSTPFIERRFSTSTVLKIKFMLWHPARSEMYIMMCDLSIDEK